jgi:hypothetical protein
LERGFPCYEKLDLLSPTLFFSNLGEGTANAVSCLANDRSSSSAGGISNWQRMFPLLLEERAGVEPFHRLTLGGQVFASPSSSLRGGEEFAPLANGLLDPPFVDSRNRQTLKVSPAKLDDLEQIKAEHAPDGCKSASPQPSRSYKRRLEDRRAILHLLPGLSRAANLPSLACRCFASCSPAPIAV